MKRLVVAAFAALLVVGATSPAQAERTTITYALGGQVSVIIPATFTSPVFSPLAPGPGGVGSTISFLFDSSLSHPIISGNVTILTFVQSNGITVPGLAVGFNLFTLIQPGGITGGHLFPGSIVTGAGGALGQPNGGYIHCTATKGACPQLGIPTYYQSIQLPRAATTPIPFGQPIPFPIPHTNPLAPPPTQTLGGWFFSPSGFGTVVGVRPFCTAFTALGLCSGAEGVITLVGTEINRVKTPEPAVLPLVALSLLGAGGAAVWSRRRNRA